MKNKKNLLLLAGAILLLLIVYLLFQGKPGAPAEEGVSVRYSGSYPHCLEPLNGTISYGADGSFKASFVNTLGLPVKIVDMSASEGSSGQACAVEYPRNVSFAPGHELSVSASCPRKDAGVRFEVNIKAGCINPLNSAQTNETMSIDGNTITK